MPTEPTNRLYCNYASNWFILVDGIYYSRQVGKSWVEIDESRLPSDLVWSNMPDKMWEAFKDVLPQ